MRHPRLCNWYTDYGRCKFNPCKFKHVEKNNALTDIIKITTKLKEVDKGLAELKEKEKQITSNIDKLKQLEKRVEENEERLRFMENTTEKKFETLESKINTLTKCIEEKGCIIDNLTNKLKLQNISEKNMLDSEVKFGKLEKRVYVIEKTKLGNVRKNLKAMKN